MMDNPGPRPVADDAEEIAAAAPAPVTPAPPS